MVKRKQPKKTVVELIRDLDQVSTFARKNAMVELASKKAAEAAPRLREFFDEPDAALRACAAWAIGEIGDSQAVGGLEGLLNDMDTEVRRNAVRSLGQLEDPRSMPALERAVKDSDRWVGELAGKALDSLRSRREEERKARTMKREEPEILELKA